MNLWRKNYLACWSTKRTKFKKVWINQEFLIFWADSLIVYLTRIFFAVQRTPSQTLPQRYFKEIDWRSVHFLYKSTIPGKIVKPWEQHFHRYFGKWYRNWIKQQSKKEKLLIMLMLMWYPVHIKRTGSYTIINWHMFKPCIFLM